MKGIFDTIDKAYKLYAYHKDCSQAVKLIHSFIGKLYKLLNRLEQGEREEIKKEADELLKEFNNFKQRIAVYFNYSSKNTHYFDFHTHLDQTIEIFDKSIKSISILDKDLCDSLADLIYKFKQSKKNIHPLPHPFQNSISLGNWKARLLIFVVPLIVAIAVFYCIDQLIMVPNMEKNCQIPFYRSFSWLNVDSYQLVTRESNKIAGVCYINNYSSKKDEQLLNKAGEIFEDLKKIDTNRLQATFFLDYIQELRGSDSGYSRAITMYDDYRIYK
jgi:hypothetical protein